MLEGRSALLLGGVEPPSSGLGVLGGVEAEPMGVVPVPLVGVVPVPLVGVVPVVGATVVGGTGVMICPPPPGSWLYGGHRRDPVYVTLLAVTLTLICWPGVRQE